MSAGSDAEPMTVVKAAAEAAAATEMPEPSAPPVVFGPVISGNLMEKTFHDGNPDGGSHSSSEAAPSGGEDDHDGLTVGSDSDSRLRCWDELSVCTDVENPITFNEVKPFWLPPDDAQADASLTTSLAEKKVTKRAFDCSVDTNKRQSTASVCPADAAK